MIKRIFSFNRTYQLGIIFSLVVVASFIFQLPSSYELDTFALYDPGATLRLDGVVAAGYRPTLDFGYPYGLLALLVGRAFFAAAGRSPASYLVFMLCGQLVIVFGMARLAARLGGTIISFITAALPHAVIPVYLTIIHPLEGALLIHALADLLAGWYARALALTTLCVFVKPSMAYVLGLLIVLLMIGRFWQQHMPASVIIRQFIPAIICGLAGIVVSITAFGIIPFKNSLLPLAGRKSYQALNFGFFGNGRSFWLPQATSVADYARHYLFTPAGLWLLSTLLLGVFGIASLRQLYRGYSEQHATLAVIAICHFFFIFILFGWPGSWSYYSYLLVVGLGIGLAVYGIRARWIWLLLLLAIIGHTQRYQNTINAWRWRERAPELAGLWAYPSQRADWARVRAKAAQQEIFYLSNGCAELLITGVRGPVTFFLSPGSQTPTELARIAQQLDQAEVVLTFAQGPLLDPWQWAAFTSQRQHFVETWRGAYLVIYERVH